MLLYLSRSIVDSPEEVQYMLTDAQFVYASSKTVALKSVTPQVAGEASDHLWVDNTRSHFQTQNLTCSNLAFQYYGASLQHLVDHYTTWAHYFLLLSVVSKEKHYLALYMHMRLMLLYYRA